MKRTHLLPAVATLVLAAAGAHAENTSLDTLDLSLEELMNVVVTSVSRKAQTLAKTAAAAYVIQAEEIRRSGATNIPEALRLAPGVQVAAIGANKWAVSIRGQADRFSNKLLVLVDGRSVYSPLFSGVIWETLDVPLENIERIEVIRGPGASIWGTNAVNGVINIITRSAFDTLGGFASVAAGDEMRGQGLARYGSSPDPDTAIQLYAKAQTNDPGVFAAGGKGADDWQTRSAGFKLEHLLNQDTFRFEGGLITSKAGDEIMMINPTSISPQRATQEMRSGHLLGHWESAPGESGQKSFQVYADHSDYDHIVLSERRTTLDLEFQQSLNPSPNQALTWGLGYRYSKDRIVTSSVISLPESETSTSLYSVYLQDEITLAPERWRLSLGARLEHNDYTGYEFQPNLRLLWTPDTQSSLWASIARAIRSPSRVERGGTVTLPLSPASALQLDNGLSTEEKLDALDLGWRYQFNRAFSLDMSAFAYRYSNLRDSAITGLPIAQPGGYVFIPSINSNANSANASGFEVSLDWRPRTAWRVQAAYSYFDSTVHLAPGRLSSGYADTTPAHLLSLRASLEMSSKLHGDAWLRHVSHITNGSFSIPAYTTLDLRLAWQAKPTLELSLTGQNLLDSAHLEYGSSFILSTPSEVQRGIYAKANWKF